MKTMKRIATPAVLLALIGAKSLISLEPVGTDRPLSPGGSTPAQGISQVERREELAGKVFDSAQRYLSEDVSDTLRVRNEIASIIAEARKEARIQAGYSASPFQGAKNAAWAVNLGIQQQLGGGDELTNYTERALRPAVGLLSRTRVQLMESVEGLRDRSAARCNDYRKEVLSFAGEADLELVGCNVDSVFFSELAASINAIIARTMSAEIAAGLEVALVKSTIASIGNVMGPIIKKAAEALGISGGLVVVDGPIPLGDAIAAIVAAGGTIWTAYDIHQAVRENALLPGMIDSLLQRQLDHFERSTTCAVDQIGAAYSEIYQTPQ